MFCVVTAVLPAVKWGVRHHFLCIQIKVEHCTDKSYTQIVLC